MYSTYLDIQNNQSISFHIRGNTISFYSVAFEAEQHLIYTRVGSFHLLSAPPLWMSSGQNVTCRNRISEKYPVGIDIIHLNARNAEILVL